MSPFLSPPKTPGKALKPQKERQDGIQKQEERVDLFGFSFSFFFFQNKSSGMTLLWLSVRPQVEMEIRANVCNAVVVDI